MNRSKYFALIAVVTFSIGLVSVYFFSTAPLTRIQTKVQTETPARTSPFGKGTGTIQVRMMRAAATAAATQYVYEMVNLPRHEVLGGPAQISAE